MSLSRSMMPRKLLSLLSDGISGYHGKFFSTLINKLAALDNQNAQTPKICQDPYKAMPLSTTSCLRFWVNQIKVFCAKLRCAHVKIRNFALFKTAYMERPKHSLITCETHPFVHY